MKIIKKIGITLLLLIVLLLVVALFVKGDYAIEREIVINEPSNEVFTYIKQLKNQDHYSKWSRMDPNMKKTYKGTDGTVGFVSAWKSNNENVGAGEQEITKIIEGKKLECKLRFKEPFEAQNDVYLMTEAIGTDKTKVKWGFTGSTPYPMNLMCLFVNMDEMIGGDFETGLKNLKQILEK